MVFETKGEGSGLAGGLTKIISFEYKKTDTPKSIADEMVQDLRLKPEVGFLVDRTFPFCWSQLYDIELGTY